MVFTISISLSFDTPFLLPFHPKRRSEQMKSNLWHLIVTLSDVFFSLKSTQETKLERETILSHSITTDFSFFSHHIFFLISAALEDFFLSFSLTSSFSFCFNMLNLFSTIFFVLFETNYVAQNYRIIIFNSARRFTRKQSLWNNTLVTNIHYIFPVYIDLCFSPKNFAFKKYYTPYNVNIHKIGDREWASESLVKIQTLSASEKLCV